MTLHSAIFRWKRQKRFHYFKPVGKSYVYQTYQNGSTPASDSCRRQVNPGRFQNTTWHIPTYEWSCPCILGYLGDLDDKIDDMIPAELNVSETERKYNITGYAEHTKKENKCVSLSEMHKVFFFPNFRHCKVTPVWRIRSSFERGKDVSKVDVWHILLSEWKGKQSVYTWKTISGLFLFFLVC